MSEKSKRPRRLYGSADIARELGVSRAVMSNYLVRHRGLPAPVGETPGGRKYWDLDGKRAWKAWHRDRRAGK